jgi:hypothetical protein
MAINYIKWPEIDQRSIKYTIIFHWKTFQITQIAIFGLKINHLATLPPMINKKFYFIFSFDSPVVTAVHFKRRRALL